MNHFKIYNEKIVCIDCNNEIIIEFDYISEFAGCKNGKVILRKNKKEVNCFISEIRCDTCEFWDNYDYSGNLISCSSRDLHERGNKKRRV